MSQPITPTPRPGATAIKRTAPPAIWFAAGALAVITVVTFFTAKTGYVAIAALVEAAVLFGLVRGHKWAYAVVIIGTVAGVAAAFSRNSRQAITVLLGDAVVLVPVLLSTSYFFPAQASAKDSKEPTSTNNQKQGDVV